MTKLLSSGLGAAVCAALDGGGDASLPGPRPVGGALPSARDVSAGADAGGSGVRSHAVSTPASAIAAINVVVRTFVVDAGVFIGTSFGTVAARPGPTTGLDAAA